MKPLSELAKRVADARPGDAIALADGAYGGERCRLTAEGSADRPITIRAENTGKAIIRAPVSVEGNGIHLEGLRFVEKGGIEIRGGDCRISRCAMTDVRTGKWVRVLPESRHIEIDHCRFENKTDNRVEMRGCQLMQIVVRNAGEAHHIHHNHFVDVPDGKSSNGYETLQLITEGNPYDPAPGHCGSLIERNLFERCNGEAEIISVKSNGNTLRRNTFRDCRGALVLRHGDGNAVAENFFFGDGEPRAGGVRLQGADQVVVNNLFHALRAFGVAMMDGAHDDLYVRTERALVAFNTFAGCDPALVVGLNHSAYPNGAPPKNCAIANNIFTRRGARDAGFRTVRLVNGDEPVDWLWEGNVTDGALGMPERDGIRTERIAARHLPNGVVAPAESSGLIGVAEGRYPDVATDILGHSRGDRKTVGCVEFPARREDGGPLTAADVGPDQ